MDNQSAGGHDRRTAGWLTILGALTMAVGAGLGTAAGTDIDTAAGAGSAAMLELLSAAEANRTFLVANLSTWIVGVLVLGAGGAALALTIGRGRLVGTLTALGYAGGGVMGTTSFVAMLMLPTVFAGGADSDLMAATAFALFGSRLDWIATLLILAVGPVMISRLDGDDWLPGWLHKLSLLAVVAGLLTVVALFTNALATYGFLTVPAGMIWHLAAGIYFVKGRRVG